MTVTMVALQGDFAYSFVAGVLAAVNPCGFLLLPTYLMYFLGVEGSQSDQTQRASLQRALSVSAAVSLGFLSVFLVVGIVTRLFTSVIQDNAKYASFLIGIGLIVMGVAMLAGWKPTVRTPALVARRENTALSMFVFGIAYAVASIGCTIGLLTTAILGSIGTHGFISGVVSIALYGLGMAMLVTALTLSLALARGGLVRTLRNGLRHIDTVAAVFVLLTGAYLTWYWFTAITERDGTDVVIDRVEGWQSKVTSFLQDQGATRLATVCGILIVGTFAFVRRSSNNRGGDAPRV